jgi:hypothetical protein
MPVIGWNESNPADSESAGLGDDRIRSLTTSVRAGLDGEHVWPSAGGDAGVHRLGSARAYVGTQSAVSSAGTQGRLMFASDTSQFFHVGSGGTSLIGGSRVLSVGTTAGFTYPQRHQWVEEFGAVQLGSSGSVTVSIPNSGYSGVPFVFYSQFTTAGSQQGSTPLIYNLGAAAFLLYDGVLGSGASGAVFAWRSIGTRVL